MDGELIDASGNTPRHNLLRDRLLSLLLRWTSDHKAGTVIAEQEFDFSGNAFGPDLAYFRAEKQKLLDLDKRVQRFVPDLAIEIASESDTYDGLLRKKERYRQAGTGEVWLISAANREIAQYSAEPSRIWGSGEVLSSGLLPGFCAALDDLFQGL